MASNKLEQNDLLVTFPVKTLLFVLVLHVIVRQIRYQTFIDINHYWPLSTFLPKYPLLPDLIVLLGIFLTGYCLVNIWRRKPGSPLLLILPIVLLIGTNLFQDVKREPPIFQTSSANSGYWHDAKKVTSLKRLWQHYTVLQPTLGLHNRTHPPGPMTMLYLTKSLPPIFLSVITLLLLYSALIAFKGTIAHVYDSNEAQLSALLLGLLPAVQIYGLLTLDAIILSLFTLAFAFWQKSTKPLWHLLATIFTWIASLFTFLIIFLLPVLVFDDYRRNRTVLRSLVLLLGFTTLHGGMYLISGYNYVESFLVGSRFEPKFYMFETPLNYVVTRLENVLEILIFFTPFLSLLLIRQLTRQIKDYRSLLISPTATGLFAIVMLLGMYGTGAFYTGETARNSLFIVPFLLLIVTEAIKQEGLNDSTKSKLLVAVLTQTVVMQLFGWWGW